MAAVFFNPNLIRLGLAALLGKYTFNVISESIRNLRINSNLKYHVLTEKHRFTPNCKNECILEIAEKLKATHSIYKQKHKGIEIPVIEGTDRCKHSCLIEVHLSIPPQREEWEVQTSYHLEPCKAK